MAIESQVNAAACEIASKSESGGGDLILQGSSKRMRGKERNDPSIGQIDVEEHDLFHRDAITVLHSLSS
jgi:hypothetical protein